MSEKRTIMARIRTVIVVTLISAMVWFLAESRMVRSETIESQISISSSLQGGGVDLVVRELPIGTTTRSVSIEIEGSTSGIDRFSHLLQNRFELQIGREIPPRPGRHTLDLRAILRQASGLSVHGMTIKSVTPETITVEVDELESRVLPVRVRLPEGVETDGPPRAEPASIRIQAPASELASMSAQEAIIRLTHAQIAQLTPGRLETIPGSLVSIDGLDLGAWATSIEPSQVDVLVTLKTVTLQYQLGRLPIQILMAPGEVGSWRVLLNEADQDLVGVMVEGPIDGIEALRSGRIVPTAYIWLSFEDLERGRDSKPAQIMGLPAGCRVVSPEQSIGFRIERIVQQLPVESGGADPGPPDEN